MNWFLKLIHWLAYISYTPGNLALGSEKADRLRKDIKCNVHLLMRSITLEQFRAYTAPFVSKTDVLGENESVRWWLLWHEKESKLELRCVSGDKKVPQLLFSSLEQGEIPIDYLVSIHESLKQVIRNATYRYGGTGTSLRPFVQIAKYDF